jgi:hypothetical protein
MPIAGVGADLPDNAGCHQSIQAQVPKFNTGVNLKGV